MRVQVKKLDQLTITAIPQFERFQPGAESALLFVEQTIEQEDGAFSSSGEIYCRDASTKVGTVWALRRARSCRRRMTGSQELYR
jgi:hypothetical protein